MKAKCTQENKTIGSIAIVILNYNNAEDTIECVESIKLIDDLEFKDEEEEKKFWDWYDALYYLSPRELKYEKEHPEIFEE